MKSAKDADDDLRLESCIFITEGLSASGSITKSRDVRTQAVFSLRGKPLNCYGLSKSVVYENEEFNCLQSALNIEDGLDELRYNKVIIATDADVDGMHIRLDQVNLRKEDNVKDLLAYYMGKNTTERQQFIIDNLVIEEDRVDEIDD